MVKILYLKYPTFEKPCIPLVDSFVRDHLVFGEDIPVVAQEILGLLSCQISIEDILNKIKRIDLSQIRLCRKDDQTVSRCRSMMSIKADALFRF